MSARCEFCIERDPADGYTRTCREPAVAEVHQMWGQPYEACDRHATEAEDSGLPVYRHEVTP